MFLKKALSFTANDVEAEKKIIIKSKKGKINIQDLPLYKSESFWEKNDGRTTSNNSNRLTGIEKSTIISNNKAKILSEEANNLTGGYYEAPIIDFESNTNNLLD